MSLIGKLASQWAVDNILSLPKELDLIVMVSHGATATKPTDGAITVAELSSIFASRFFYTPVYFGVFTESPKPEIEEIFKKGMVPRAICVGTVISTIEECLKIKEAFLSTAGSLPKNILVVTDQAHSRRAYLVWKTFFPESTIYMATIRLEKAVDKESPMRSYHYAWTALLFQAAPTFPFWILAKCGPNIMKLFAKILHQPVAR